MRPWQADNSMVLAWLINSMEAEVSQNFILCDTAKQLWDTVNLMYSNLNNDSQLYDLRRKVQETKEGSLSATTYFNILNHCWMELDLYQDFEWKSEEDFLQYKKIVQKERVFDFLGGLNPEFDAVRGRILGMRPIPSVTETYAEIRREESRLAVMVKKETPALTESSALAVGKNEQNWSTQRGTLNKSEEKEKRCCDFCNKPGHIRDKCWKLHGKPVNFSKGTNSGKAFQISIDQQQKIGTEDQVFSKSQMELLQKMFNNSISQ